MCEPRHLHGQPRRSRRSSDSSNDALALPHLASGLAQERVTSSPLPHQAAALGPSRESHTDCPSPHWRKGSIQAVRRHGQPKVPQHTVGQLSQQHTRTGIDGVLRVQRHRPGHQPADDSLDLMACEKAPAMELMAPEFAQAGAPGSTLQQVAPHPFHAAFAAIIPDAALLNLAPGNLPARRIAPAEACGRHPVGRFRSFHPSPPPGFPLAVGVSSTSLLRQYRTGSPRRTTSPRAHAPQQSMRHQGTR
jgi:hypothetical protein